MVNFIPYLCRTPRTLLARRKSPTWTTGPRGRTTQGKTLNVCKFMGGFYTFLQEEGDRGPQELCRGGEPGQVIQLSILNFLFTFPICLNPFFKKIFFRKDEIAALKNFAEGENDQRKEEIADINARFVYFFLFYKKIFN